jgi:hypothetical protein
MRILHILISSALIILLVSSCNLLPWMNNDDAEEDGISPEIDFTPVVPALPDGTTSYVTIEGELSGQPFNLSWDYSERGVVTNGLISTQISSSRPGTVSITFDNDFHDPDNPQEADDYLVRFTIGSFMPGDTVANGKRTFTIPETVYAMITLQKGPAGTEYRHFEHNSNNLLTIRITDSAYDPLLNTLRLKGGMRSEWDNDWVEAGFNVLIGGDNDRHASLNQSSFDYAFE